MFVIKRMLCFDLNFFDMSGICSGLVNFFVKVLFVLFVKLFLFCELMKYRKIVL